MRILFMAAMIVVLAPAAQGATFGAASPATASRPTAMRANGAPLPDLTFSFVTVERATYPVMPSPTSILVVDAQRDANACQKSFSFPLQLIVKNIGQADFVLNPTYAEFEVVGISIGTWNTATKLSNITKGASQPMNFNVSLLPGRYTLQAQIDLHTAGAELRIDNNALNWPFEVRCDTHAMAPTPITAPALFGRTPTRAQPPAR